MASSPLLFGRAPVPLSVALLLSASACGTTPTPSSVDSGSDDASTTTAPTHTIVVNDFAYSPAKLTIKVGDIVEWSFTSGTHSVTSGASCTPDGKVDSGQHGSPFAFRRTFTEKGTFPYFCSYKQHCSQMGQEGTITIEE